MTPAQMAGEVLILIAGGRTTAEQIGADLPGVRPANLRLLLGHLANEGKIIPDGRGGYTLHPRERDRQQARWQARLTRVNATQTPNLSTRLVITGGSMTPRRILDSDGWHDDTSEE